MGTTQMRGCWKEEDKVDVDNGAKVKRRAGVDCIMEVVREKKKKKNGLDSKIRSGID